jgi:hypothetical protein
MCGAFFTARAIIWLGGMRYPGEVMQLIQIYYHSQNVIILLLILRIGFRNTNVAARRSRQLLFM